jgi:hypothetical protein
MSQWPVRQPAGVHSSVLLDARGPISAGLILLYYFRKGMLYFVNEVTNECVRKEAETVPTMGQAGYSPVIILFRGDQRISLLGY